MDGGMTTTVCTVATARRCEAVTDGPHSRVAHAGGVWWRWLPMGGWVQSRRVAVATTERAPSLVALAAGVPARDRAAALAAIGVPT